MRYFIYKSKYCGESMAEIWVRRPDEYEKCLYSEGTSTPNSDFNWHPRDDSLRGSFEELLKERSGWKEITKEEAFLEMV